MTKPIFPHDEQPAGDKPLFVPLKAEFYEAFDVKEGDKMYIKPEDRVKIW